MLHSILFIQSYPRSKFKANFERYSDLLDYDGRRREVDVASLEEQQRRIDKEGGREERKEKRKGEERRSEKKREKKRGESRPIRAPRQGDLCLIRRSRLAEAVRTGIHIRYGPGSGCTLILVFVARLRRSFHKPLQFANIVAFSFVMSRQTLYVNSI